MAAELQLAGSHSGSSSRVHSDPESAYVELLLYMTRADLRKTRNILDDRNSMGALGIKSRDDGIGLEINRGDNPIKNAPARLFFGNRENPDGPCRVLIPGLSINRLDPNSGGFDRDLIVKALTVDGSGGSLNWSGDKIPLPCLWFYIENFFIKKPDGIDLSRLKGVRGQRHTSQFSEWIFHDNFQTTHAGRLQKWFTQEYRPREAVTHRPITEDYLRQLQAAPLNDAQKKARGELFFGRNNYHDLLTRIARP